MSRSPYCKTCGALMQPRGMVAASPNRPSVCIECDDEAYDQDAREYECNLCFATSLEVSGLASERGRACPFCGEGVIHEVGP